jgi:hypothetical protein
VPKEKCARFAFCRISFSKMSKFTEKLLSPSALAVAVHLAIALPLARLLNVWLDEAWTMQTTARNVSFAWREAIAVEHQAPLYFALMSVWRALDDSLFFARLFSILCICATILVVPSLVERFAAAKAENDSRFLRFALPLVFALHPYAVWASVEARVYALVVLLSALLMLVWFDAYAAPKDNARKMQAFYVLLAALALYTNYYLGFLLFANACALLWLKKWKAFAFYVAQMCAVGLLFLPLVFAVREQFAVNADYYREAVSAVDGLKLVWNVFNYFLLPSAESDTVAFWRVLAARLACLALLVLTVSRFRRLDSTTAALGVAVAVVAAFIMTAYFLAGVEYVQMRHCAVLFAPLVLFAAVFVRNIADRRGIIVWLALLVVFAPTRLYENYEPLRKNGDWTRVAEYIKENESEDDEPIATFQLPDAIPLAFAYKGKNRILRAESLDDWADEDKPLTPNRWRKQIEVLIAQISASQTHLWLVTESYCHEGLKTVECEPLEDFVRENFETEKSADFYKRRVRLLRRK